MPYVPVESVDPHELVGSAERRWTAALLARPDLKPAIDLQRSLIATVVELIGAIELQRLPRLSLPPKYVAAKLSRGVPALAEVAGGHRILRCSFCAAGWELNSYACIYCLESAEAFVTAAPDEERKDRRVELCLACGGYLKTVDVAALSPFPLLAIADLETMDLDMAAMERGYARPRLRNFDTKR